MPATGNEISKGKPWHAPDRRLVVLASLLLIGASLALLTNNFSMLDIKWRPKAGPKPIRAATAPAAARKLPVYFIPNRSQIDHRVKFYAAGPGYSFFLTDNEATYSFMKKAPSAPKAGAAKKDVSGAKRAHSLKIKFEGANRSAPVAGEAKLATRINYLKGRDRSRWQTDLPTFAQVRYENLYDKIDLVYRGNPEKIKYEFLVKPGADYRKIRLSYAGIDSLALNDHGDLVIRTPIGKLIDEKPYIYQKIGGKKVAVKGDFALAGRTVSFLAGNYDPAYPLVIDPGLAYSTFIGGGSLDTGVDVLALDPSGNAYITGNTNSVNFPAKAGSYDVTQNGGSDVFISKVNPAGSALIYSTFLGGSANDYGYGLTLDAGENVYVTGYSSSADFPTTPGAYDTTLGAAPDVFVTKLDSSGSTLAYSTFIGGAGTDYGRGLAVDASAQAYVTGYTGSADFPTTPGAFDTALSGSRDVFVAKLDSAGSALVYSTLVGGSSADYGYNLALNDAGNAFITGHTFSGDWPTSGGALDAGYNGAGDAFAAKVNEDGTGLVYSTYFGGAGTDYGYGLALDAAGNAFLAGQTNSADLPVTGGAFDTTINGGYDAFSAKLGPGGDALAYSTFVGGAADDYANGVSVDSSGAAYLTGQTSSADFPTTPGALGPSKSGGVDAFVAKIAPSGAALDYSTFLGGGGTDSGLSLAVDTLMNIFITGQTNSPDFPTSAGAFDVSNSGSDAFIAKLDIEKPSTSLATAPASPDGDAGWFVSTTTVSLTADESATTMYQWDSTTGPWSEYGLPVGAPQGSHTLFYFSVDLADNTETVKDQALDVDRVGPAVVGLNGTAPSPTSIDLSWTSSADPVSGLAGYHIFNADTGLELADTTTTGHQFIGLTPGATYRYYVKARDNAGNFSNRSGIKTITTPSTTPATGVNTIFLLLTANAGIGAGILAIRNARRQRRRHLH